MSNELREAIAEALYAHHGSKHFFGDWPPDDEKYPAVAMVHRSQADALLPLVVSRSEYERVVGIVDQARATLTADVIAVARQRFADGNDYAADRAILALAHLFAEKEVSGG